MRWVYTGIIRPKLTYGALVWAHNLSSKQHKKLKQLNRIACMSLTPTTRSTPQAALEIMYNIIPLDLHLTEAGLKSYLRLKVQLDQPKRTFFFVWCRHGQAHVEWRPAGVFIIRYDIFRTKAGVAMTTIACPLILYSIRASFVSLL